MMNISSSKENILKKIRKALSHSTPFLFRKVKETFSVSQPHTGTGNRICRAVHKAAGEIYLLHQPPGTGISIK